MPVGTNMGAPSGTGSRASHEADKSSSPKASIPSADERLAELLALRENWNSYHARPIDPGCAERVRAMFPLLEKLGLNPWISPLSDGSLQIERAGTDDYCIEFNRDGTASVSFDGVTDADALGFVSQFAMVSALNRIASVDRDPQGQDPAEGLGAEHESAVGVAETPNTHPQDSNQGSGND
jgi:hypothetical protein